MKKSVAKERADVVAYLLTLSVGATFVAAAPESDESVRDNEALMSELGVSPDMLVTILQTIADRIIEGAHVGSVDSLPRMALITIGGKTVELSIPELIVHIDSLEN